MGNTIQQHRAAIGSFRHSGPKEVEEAGETPSCTRVCYVLFIMMLLLRAGIDTNPGPQQNDIGDWEFSDSTKEYKTDGKLCAVCGGGNVTAVLRKTEQSEMLVYTRNGIIKGKHLEYRCNSRRKNECIAYHGYVFFIKRRGESL